MAKLEGQKIADSYEQLLHTDRDGGGNGTTLVDIKDGKNDNTFALQLATDKVQANGTLTVGVDDTGYDVKFFGDTATNGYMLWDASTDDLILGSSSKLGIGTTTPSSFDSEANNLVVGDGSGDNGITIFTGSSAGNHGSIFFGDATGTPKQGQIRYEQNNEVMSFHTNTTERMRIDLNGNVGIGTDSPTHAKMEIIGEADAFQLTMSDVADSDNTTKEARMGMLHYKSAEEPVTLFYAQSGSSTNDIYIGGGTGAGNHATSVAIATASTYNSTSTTTNMKIDNNSRISLSNNDGNTDNTVFGYNAFTNNGTVLGDVGADRNVAIGDLAMGTGTTTTALNNVAIGASALTDLTDGDSNVSIGAFSATNITTGIRNIAIGTEANATATTASDIISIGASAGFAILANNTASDGTIAIGTSSLTALTNGANNVAIGYQSMSETTGGNYNTAIGYQAMYRDAGLANTHNTFVGQGIASGDWANNPCTHNTGMGSGAMQGAMDGAVGNTALGVDALNGLTSGDNNVAIGRGAGSSISSASGNTIVGRLAGDALNANSNVVIGDSALGAATTATENIAIGGDAMSLVQAGQAITGVVAIGQNALKGGSTTTAIDGSIAIGKDSLKALTSGAKNTAIGFNAMAEIADGNNNTAVGYGAMQNSVGGTTSDGSSNNTFVGYLSGGGQWANSNSAGNTAVGSETAMSDDWNGTSYSSLFGFRAGQTISTGSRNTLFGYSSGSNITTGSGNTQIGASAQASAADVTDEIVLKAGSDNLAGGGTETIRIGVDSDYITNDFGENATWTHSSDKRIKKNIKSLDLGLQFVNDLKPVTFNKKAPSEYPKEFEQYNPKKTKRINPDAVNYGFIAQEVKESMDKAGHSKFPMWKENKDGMQMLGETALIPTLVKAIQELSAKVTELENKLK
jgi:trimeric autotransporter adhesin